MPTGYTCYIEDGDIKTGKDFLMLCTRAFGIALDVRDEPLSVPTPTKFYPSHVISSVGQVCDDELENILNNAQKYSLH